VDRGRVPLSFAPLMPGLDSNPTPDLTHLFAQ